MALSVCSLIYQNDFYKCDNPNPPVIPVKFAFSFHKLIPVIYMVRLKKN